MEDKNNETKPLGVLFTIRDIHDLVQKIDSKMDDKYDKLNEEITKIKVQVAGMAVITGLVTVAVASILGKVLIP